MVGTMLSPDFWFNADQRGDWLFRHGKFEQAAKIFSDPLRQGVALYRAGDFLPASKTFVRVRDAVGAFDQGDALLMHGAYDQAIAAFDRALGLHPGWKEAEENRALAVIRRDRLQIQGGNMTEGMEEGNKPVINLNAKNGQSRTFGVEANPALPGPSMASLSSKSPDLRAWMVSLGVVTVFIVALAGFALWISQRRPEWWRSLRFWRPVHLAPLNPR